MRWLLLPTAYVLICRNGIPGSTGDCVAGSSAAYENQALHNGMKIIVTLFGKTGLNEF